MMPLSKEEGETGNKPYYDSDELTVMAFFNRMRTYKVQSEHYSPAVFAARLDAGHMFHVAGATDSDESNVLPIIGEEFEDDIDIDDTQDPLVKSTTEKTPNLGDLARAPDSESLPSAQTLNSHSLRTLLADISLDATPSIPPNSIKHVSASQVTPNSRIKFAKRIISTDATVSRAPCARPNQTIRSPSHAAGDHSISPVAMKSTTKRSNVSPGIKSHSSLSITKKGGPAPRGIPSVPAAATPPNSSQTPVKPVSAAPVYASRIVKRLGAHNKTTSVPNVGSSFIRSSINTKEQITQAASRVPIHKPTLTGVSRPTAPSLSKVNGSRIPRWRAQTLTDVSRSVRSTISKPTTQTSSLSKVPSMEIPRASETTTASKVTHPPSRFTAAGVASGPVTPLSWRAETVTKGGDSEGSTILKPTIRTAPSMEMPKAPKTSAASKVARPPSRLTVVAMAYGLLRFPGSLLHSCRLPVPASSALHSTKLPNTGGGPNMNRKNDSIGGVQGIFQNGTIGAYAHKIRVSLHLVSRYLRIPWLIPT